MPPACPYRLYHLYCLQALVAEYKSLGAQREAAAQAAASKLEAELKKAQVGEGGARMSGAGTRCARRVATEGFAG